jgi:epoxyqueuosine reductase QueG
MSDSLKSELVTRLKQAGAYDVRVANPRQGFENALPDRHPLDLWQQCKSIIIFAVARAPHVNNMYLGPHAPWNGQRNLGPVPHNIQSEEYAMVRLSWLFVNSILLRGVMLLAQKGYQVSFERIQLKLAAFEAGLGVYGRSGVILHPELGNRICLGAILTDASLEADGRLQGYSPCDGCDRCVRMCPAQAFDPKKEYPASWSREICVTKRQEIAHKGEYCHNCFTVCPAGTISDEELLSIKTATSFYKPHRVSVQLSFGQSV